MTNEYIKKLEKQIHEQDKFNRGVAEFNQGLINIKSNLKQIIDPTEALKAKTESNVQAADEQKTTNRLLSQVVDKIQREKKPTLEQGEQANTATETPPEEFDFNDFVGKDTRYGIRLSKTTKPYFSLQTLLQNFLNVSRSKSEETY